MHGSPNEECRVLEEQLNEAIAKEDYVTAAKLQQELDKKQAEQDAAKNDLESCTSSSTTTTATTITTITTTATTATTTATITAPKESDVDDATNPKLVDKGAVKFWNEHFGTRMWVSNDEFQKGIQKKFEEQKKIQKDDDSDLFSYNDSTKSQTIFAEAMVNQIFWPARDHTTNESILKKGNNPSYVDQACVQFAINTFGPWKQIFQSINMNLQDAEAQNRGLDYFHGRITKVMIQEKLKRQGDFALRYHAKGGLMLCWARSGSKNEVMMKEDRVQRVKIKNNPNPTWKYNEKIPLKGKARTKKKYFDTLSLFLNYRQEQANVTRWYPNMYDSKYESIGRNSPKNKKDLETESRVNEQVDEKLSNVG